MWRKTSQRGSEDYSSSPRTNGVTFESSLESFSFLYSLVSIGSCANDVTHLFYEAILKGNQMTSCSGQKQGDLDIITHLPTRKLGVKVTSEV